MEKIYAKYFDSTCLSSPGLIHWDNTIKRLSFFGNYDTLQKTIVENTSGIVQLYVDSLAVNITNVSAYEVFREIDELFDFINNINKLDDGIVYASFKIEEVSTLLNVVKSNLLSLKLVDTYLIQSVLDNSIITMYKNSNLIDKYESTSIKVKMLLNQLNSRLDKLVALNAKNEALDLKISQTFNYAHLESATLHTKNEVVDYDEAVTQLIVTTSQDSSIFCSRLNSLELLLTDLNNSLAVAATVESLAQNIDTDMQSTKQAVTSILRVIDSAQTKCAELDMFVRCLEIYESQMIKSGKNASIEKEDVVFKVGAPTPKIPDCPAIIYITHPPTTTTPKPTKPPTPKPTTTTSTTSTTSTKPPTSPPGETTTTSTTSSTKPPTSPPGETTTTTTTTTTSTTSSNPPPAKKCYYAYRQFKTGPGTNNPFMYWNTLSGAVSMRHSSNVFTVPTAFAGKIFTNLQEALNWVNSDSTTLNGLAAVINTAGKVYDKGLVGYDPGDQWHVDCANYNNLSKIYYGGMDGIKSMTGKKSIDEHATCEFPDVTMGGVIKPGCGN